MARKASIIDVTNSGVGAAESDLKYTLDGCRCVT